MRKNEQGFSLIELMFVVLIVGILGAVAIPAYMSYMQKSRTVSLIMPGLHSIQNNVAMFYSTSGLLPGNTQLSAMTEDANTQYFIPEITGGVIKLTINSPAATSKLGKLHGLELYSTPITGDGRIIRFVNSGRLAARLGMDD